MKKRIKLEGLIYLINESVWEPHFICKICDREIAGKKEGGSMVVYGDKIGVFVHKKCAIKTGWKIIDKNYPSSEEIEKFISDLEFNTNHMIVV